MFKLGEVAAAGLGLPPCWRKEKHPNRGRAEAAMRSLLRQDKARDTDTINAYQCPYCREWHVGHSSLEKEAQ